MPSGEQQNRCPRHHIKEDPQWWDALIEAYNGHQNSILPHAGGMSNQPALYPSIMSTIASALEDERQIEQDTKTERRNMVEHQQNAQQGKTVSLLHGPKPSGT